MCVGGGYYREQRLRQGPAGRELRGGGCGRVSSGWKAGRTETPQALKAASKDSGPRTMTDSLWKDFK